MALFSTAVIALGRLSRSTASLSVQADQRLSAQLTGENALARLQVTPLDQIDSAIKEIQSATKTSTIFDIKIEADDFKAGSQEGVHVVVRVSQAKQSKRDQPGSKPVATVADEVAIPLVTLHDWRFAESDDEAKVSIEPEQEEEDDDNEGE
ncbi:MAG: hypothetical protein WBD20_18585 [Pirellulaceae bacterium]